MENRLAEAADIGRIMEIVADAQRFLKESGVDQWQDGYPTPEAFLDDIEKGACRVFVVEGIVAGVLSVFFEPEPSYGEVENGSWLTGDEPYAVFHRAAVGRDYRGIGIASEMLYYAENMAKERGYKSMRGDTHRDNRAMRGLLEKRDYVHCGTIYLNHERNASNERVCYEKLL
ncbi:MAG: GNAT family N-acetyltransferase [Oscillospiraceae bacterium]|nr:GNAT family N-acetyltransferase [Oscillospiraceae bacterium]